MNPRLLLTTTSLPVVDADEGDGGNASPDRHTAVFAREKYCLSPALLALWTADCTTRSDVLDLRRIKSIWFDGGRAPPWSAWGAYSAPPDILALAGIKGLRSREGTIGGGERELSHPPPPIPGSATDHYCCTLVRRWRRNSTRATNDGDFEGSRFKFYMLCGTRTSSLDNLTQGPLPLHTYRSIVFARLRQRGQPHLMQGFLGPCESALTPPPPATTRHQCWNCSLDLPKLKAPK